jgi:[glutamine synthetase] adenylyltransferase / [glutamine synthetase]-adenylyl-L-tyrosine phosphorylase
MPNLPEDPQRQGLARDILDVLGEHAPFLLRLLERDADALTWLTTPHLWKRQRPASAMAATLGDALVRIVDEADVLATTRRFRARELARIAARDLMNLATVAETTFDLTSLADTCLDACCRVARRMVDERFGVPAPPAFVEGRGFAIMALGKLGASELNFSSDVDIVYLYAEEGTTRGGTRGPVSIQEWATAFAQTVTRLVERQTEDGRLFRVDLRLRPDGEQGPIATTPAAAAQTYIRSGQPWERVSLLRARHAAGDPGVTHDLLRRLEPFVYGDTPAKELILGLRHIKEQIVTHLEHKPAPGFDVKLGRGGIRELEFFAQTLQLMNAHKNAELREHRTLTLFERLASQRVITRTLAESLASDYAFLRKVEHRLQMVEDQQTHLLPRDDESRAKVARSLGIPTLAELDRTIDDVRERVHLLFQSLFVAEETEEELALRVRLATDLRPRLPRIDADALVKILDAWPIDHLRETQLDTLAVGVGLITDVERSRPVTCRVYAGAGGRLEIILAAVDRTGLASISTGVVAARGLDIQEGRLFTLPELTLHGDDGGPRAVQFLVAHAARPQLCPPPTAPALEARLTDTVNRWLSGRTDEVKREINSEWVERMRELHAADDAHMREIDLELDNRADKRATVVDIWAEDAPGFLHGFTQALAMRGISVHQTLIRTEGQRAIDRFFLTDAHGRKLVSAAARHELEVMAVLIKGFSHFLSRAADPARALTQFDLLLDRLGQEGVRAHLNTLKAEPLLAALARVLGSGSYLFEDFLRLHVDHMLPVLEALSAGHGAALSPPVEVGALVDRQRQLVSWRDAEIFRIDCEHLIRDDERFDSFAEELTFLAEGVLTRAWRYAIEEVSADRDAPLRKDGRPLPWVVAGLGKFGGAELGVASDLEILVVFDDRESLGLTAISPTELFERAVKVLKRSLPTRRAGVFELDLRLRPHGTSGPLASSLTSFMSYYRPGGGAAPFERQAMIRLRPFAGDAGLARVVSDVRDAFTYGPEPFLLKDALELRQRQVDQLVRPGVVDLKHGRGGLIEIEYGVQYLQLTHGHTTPAVRSSNTLFGLKALEQHGFVTESEADALRRAFFLFRATIDALRLERGNAKDTTLPQMSSHDAVVLARRLNKTRKALFNELGVAMLTVADVFHDRFGNVD